MLNSAYLRKKYREQHRKLLLGLPETLDNQSSSDSQVIKALLAWALVFITAIIFLCINTPAHAATIDMDKIMLIESGGRNIHSNIKSEHAIGIFQITPIVLKEYNSFHNKNYTRKDLFNTSLNRTIAHWYLNVRIPQMLRAYKKPVTVRNILISYNCGVFYVVSGKALPSVTVRYLRKYGA